MKYIFFESKYEGKNDLTSIKLVRRSFSERGKINDFIFVSLENEDETESIIRYYIKKFGDKGIYFMCGGDRLTNIAANIFAYTDLTIGIIPLAENSHAKCIYGENQDALSVCSSLGLLSGEKPMMKLKKADAASVNNHFFVNSLSLGYFAKSREILENHPFLSGLEDGISLMKSSVKLKGKFQVVSFANSHERHFTAEKIFSASVFSVTNSGYSDEGKLSFDSCITDKILEVNMIKPCNFASLSYNLELYKRGVIYDSKQGKCFKIEGAEISSFDNRPLEYIADGKLFQSNELNIKVHGAALKICCPIKNNMEKML